MMPKLARPPLLSDWGDQCMERRQCGLVLGDYGSAGSQSLPIAGERKHRIEVCLVSTSRRQMGIVNQLCPDFLENSGIDSHNHRIDSHGVSCY